MTDATILQARAEFEATRRPRGLVWQFTDEHFCAFVRWLLCPQFTYARISELCVAELKLPPAKVPDFRRISEFWQESGFRTLLIQLNRRAASGDARVLIREAQADPVDWSEATVDAIQQRTCELLADPSADTDTVRPYVQASIKLRQIEVDRERLRRAIQTKVEAGLEEIAKRLGADAALMDAIRARVRTDMAEANA